MRVEVSLVNAFIDGDFGGNPAGVILNADNLTQDQKLAIAKKVGLSETAFVSKSSVADYKLDFFTPSRQIAHCGHATIAVFSYLVQTGRIGQGWFTKETIDGNRKILIDGNMAYMEQLAPSSQEINKYHSTVINSLGLREAEVFYKPKLINTGNSFIVLGVEDEKKLAELKPDFELISSVSENLDLIGYYIFTPKVDNPQRDVTARMFAPRYGITEEAATGMAAGPMACYLYNELNAKKAQFNIEQGRLMNPPSTSVINVELNLKDDEIVSLMAGGTAKSMSDIIVEI